MIPSQQRATILSFDSLIDNAGGIVAQPALGKQRRRLGLPDVLPALGSRHRARIAFHRSGPEFQHAGRQSNGSATSHSADQLSQGGRYVTPTAAARATSSHRGSSAAPELRTDREQHLGGTLAGSEEQLAIITST